MERLRILEKKKKENKLNKGKASRQN